MMSEMATVSGHDATSSNSSTSTSYTQAAPRVADFSNSSTSFSSEVLPEEYEVESIVCSKLIEVCNGTKCS